MIARRTRAYREECERGGFRAPRFEKCGDVARADAQLQAQGLLLPLSEEVGSRCRYSLVYCFQQQRTLPVELHWRIFERYRPYAFDLDAVRAQAGQAAAEGEVVRGCGEGTADGRGVGLSGRGVV